MNAITVKKTSAPTTVYKQTNAYTVLHLTEEHRKN